MEMVVSGKTINPRGPLFVQIKGRRSGILPWFLTLIQLEAKVCFSVYKDRIEVQEDSFFWKANEYIALKNVSVLGCYYRGLLIFPLFALIFFIEAIPAIFMKTMIGLLLFALSVVFAVFYFLSKRNTIMVLVPGMPPFRPYMLSFRRSIIEGETITSADMEQIRKIFRFLMNPEQNAACLNDVEYTSDYALELDDVDMSGIEPKGASQRVFTYSQPSYPSEPVSPPVPPAPPVPPIRRPVVRPPEPPQYR